MSNYDPHADAEERGFILSYRTLPPGYRGATNLQGAIWLEECMLQREERSTLAHEIAHYDIPSGAFQGAAVEAEVDRIAACRLITFDELVSAAKWADSIEEMAEDLHVAEEMVRARISSLSGAEARSFEYQAGRIHYSMPRRKRLRSKTPLRRKTTLA